MTEQIYTALEKFYNGDVPGYVKNAGKSYITVQVGSWDGTRRIKITLKDVIVYYDTQAGNIISGTRVLANHHDDWRLIDNLAKEALAWFRHINRSALEREAKKRGMTLAG